jgi:hypothetical protein
VILRHSVAKTTIHQGSVWWGEPFPADSRSTWEASTAVSVMSTVHG